MKKKRKKVLKKDISGLGSGERVLEYYDEDWEEGTEGADGYLDEENDDDDYVEAEYTEEYIAYEENGYIEEAEEYEDPAETAGEKKAAGKARKKHRANQGRKGRKRRATGRKKETHSRRRHKDRLDGLVAAGGLLISASVVALVVLHVNAREAAEQVASFSEVGTQMEGIAVIGESGLLAMAEEQNRKAAMAEAAQEAVAVKEYDEKELYAEGSITVEMHLSSLQKDLKIKFVNQETGKLISSVPFEVTVTDAARKSYVLKDEDMDGIIYQADVTPGSCRVAMLEVEHAEAYAISTENIPVTIKDTIEYKKVDVADEVKKESEVNAAVEDTKRTASAESGLTDTVGFVESAKKISEETSNAIEKGEYEEVLKDNVVNPAAAYDEGGGEGEENIGEEPEQPTLSLNRKEAALLTGKTLQLTARVWGAEDKSVVWMSDNSGVAAVEADGVVTGTGVGTAAVMAVCNGDNSLMAICTVTVYPDPAADYETKLTDREGIWLYVIDEEGNFREAVHADYGTADKFYRKVQVEEEYKYTGWQTIDGKTYYYDAEGSRVTGEQVIQGAKYTFDNEGVLSTTSGNMGIDVSKWNGSIDWNAVKNSGVSYVIIRCGYRGSTTGALIEDPMFRSNIQGAASAGLKVGIYFVTQAVNEAEAVEEASMVIGLIGGYHISYPVFLDVEPSGGRADGISREMRTTVCRAFCQTMENSGYTAGIYANGTWLNEKMDAPSLTSYKIWLAQYMAEPIYTATKYDMWQYSAKGTVAGIAGETDLNISYLGRTP